MRPVWVPDDSGGDQPPPFSRTLHLSAPVERLSRRLPALSTHTGLNTNRRLLTAEGSAVFASRWAKHHKKQRDRGRLLKRRNPIITSVSAYLIALSRPAWGTDEGIEAPSGSTTTRYTIQGERDRKYTGTGQARRAQDVPKTWLPDAPVPYLVDKTIEPPVRSESVLQSDCSPVQRDGERVISPR